jgi:hypothetical protein
LTKRISELNLYSYFTALNAVYMIDRGLTLEDISFLGAIGIVPTLVRVCLLSISYEQR